jgi:type IV secretory pathway TrbL component
LSELPATADVGAELLEAHRADAARTVLKLYQAITVLLLLGIAGLFVYVVKLGPLLGTGVESSFGLAVAAMFVMGALLAHLADVTYRAWPLGRRFRPATPQAVSARETATWVSWFIVLAAVAGGAYIVAQLLV